MKVLFISYELPPIGGGGGRAAWQIARRLARRGHEVEIITSLFEGLPAHEEKDGVRIHRVRVRRKNVHACPPRELFSFMMRSYFSAPRLAERFRPHVVCAFFGIPGGPAAWRLMRREGIPYVLSLRGSDVPRPEISRHQRLHLLTRPFLRRLYRDAHGIVAVSRGLRDAALILEPDVSIEVIPNGVDTDFFCPRAARSFPAGRHELLFVGRLREFKGVQHGLQALPLIEKELGSPVLMNVVGDGPYRAALESLARRIRSAGARSEVRFLGWIEQSAVRRMYESASLLLLPSVVEGHPNVVLEAMAMGLPCVVSDAAGTREVLVNGREGILVPHGNEEELARATAHILRDEDAWLRMSRCARERAGHFSWDAVAEKYEASLRRAAERCIVRKQDAKGGMQNTEC